MFVHGRGIKTPLDNYKLFKYEPKKNNEFKIY